MKWILAFSLFPIVALAGPFEDLERAHNSGAPMSSIMTSDAARRWERTFKRGRGTARLVNSQWSAKRPQGLTWWDWSRGDETQSGWLAIQTNEVGKIDAFYYTEKPRPRHKVNNAIAGQSVDSVTTVYGLANGFVESNPILSGASGPAIAAVKLGTTLAIQEYAGLDNCTSASTALAGAGWGAGAWNLGLLVHPAVALIPVAAGIYAHRKAEPLWDCLPNDIRLSGSGRKERVAGH
jgi:hypothetical protein